MNTQVKTKKIGIFVDSEKTSGGAYQELLTFIKNFEKFNEKYNLNFTIVCTSKDLGFDNKLTKFKVIYFSLGFINRYIHYLFNFHHFFRRIRKFLLFKNKFESFLDINERTSGNIGGINFRKGGATSGIMTAQYFVDTSGSHYFHSQGTQRLKIANDGDLLITGSDNAELKLKCGTSTGNNVIAFLNSSGTTKGNIFYDSDNNFMVFKTNGTASSNERLRITSDGKVGIDDDTPDATLSVGGATAFIDVGAAGGNRGKIGYSSNDLYFGTSSSSGEFIFKNNVNSKYFKDQVITCLRKHASDIDNIDRLKETICKNNMYNIIKNVYKLPENINSISNMLFLINIALFSIFSINFGIIIIHLMKNYDITTLIIFSILIFILILLAFLSM